MMRRPRESWVVGVRTWFGGTFLLLKVLLIFIQNIDSAARRFLAPKFSTLFVQLLLSELTEAYFRSLKRRRVYHHSLRICAVLHRNGQLVIIRSHVVSHHNGHRFLNSFTAQ